MHYIPTIVQCMSSFAKEIPQFLDLTMDDQRLLIKGCILEAAVIHDSTHVHVDEQFWQDDKLRFRLDWQQGEELGLLGQVFHQFRPLLSKLRKLELTDAELSLLWALVLFCPGEPSAQVCVCVCVCVCERETERVVLCCVPVLRILFLFKFHSTCQKESFFYSFRLCSHFYHLFSTPIPHLSAAFVAGWAQSTSVLTN